MNQWVYRRSADGKYILFDGWMGEVVIDDRSQAVFEAENEKVASAYLPKGCVLEPYEPREPDNG